ncbi:MAG: trigger factor [Bacilli bacterium]|nr:trigger factor [Bacilli bacterium]
MKRVVNKLENSKFEVLCTIEEKDWKALQEKAFKALAKNVSAKGFRKGHVPEEMARKMVNQGEIINKAVNDAIQPAYVEVLKEENLQPFAQPTVDVTKVSDTELGLKFVIIVRPEVTLGTYKGLAVEKPVTEVTEEEVDKSIENLVAQNASLNVVEREAKLGDTVVLDFVGSVGGVEFDGGKAENYSLELGSGSFVPGFEEQLVGVKTGDVKDVVVTFPTQYVPELAGKEATFKCTVHEVKEKVLPEVNEELVADLAIDGVTTVEQLREHQKNQILSSKDAQAKNAQLDAIVNKIVEGATVEIAEEIINDEVNAMKENMKKQIEQRGLSFEQYLEITGKKMEELEKEMAVDARKNISAFLCLDKIAAVEGITVTNDDIEAEYANIAAQYSMPVEQVKEILGKQVNELAQQIRSRKINEFVVSNNSK